MSKARKQTIAAIFITALFLTLLIIGWATTTSTLYFVSISLFSLIVTLFASHYINKKG